MAYGQPSSSSVTYALTAGDEEEAVLSAAMNGGGRSGGGAPALLGAGTDHDGGGGGPPWAPPPAGPSRLCRVAAAVAVVVVLAATAIVAVVGVRAARSPRAEGGGAAQGATAAPPAVATAAPATAVPDAGATAAPAVAAAPGAPAAAAPAPAVDSARLSSGAHVPPPGVRAPRFPYTVVGEAPSDSDAFTQGFFYSNGSFFMSTGNPPLPGEPPSPAPDTSSMRLVTAATGAVRRRVTVGSRFFGEGSTRVRDRLAMISWKAGRGWLFDPTTLAPLGTWSYAGEGWGIAWDGDAAVYLSNGSSTIQVFHASNFTAGVPLRTVEVTNAGLPIARLNELEVVCGELWANVWLTTVLVRIDPATGAVVGTVDLRGLITRMVGRGVFDEAKRRSGGAVLNGIAWDRGGAGGGHAKPDAPTLWVTGKWWPRVFEVTVDDPAVDWGKCAGLHAAGLP